MGKKVADVAVPSEPEASTFVAAGPTPRNVPDGDQLADSSFGDSEDTGTGRGESELGGVLGGCVVDRF